MTFDSKFWIKFSLFNLLIVGLLGALMRYKIGYEFPYFNQKNIQQAHSNFAFVSWITHTLYVLMIHFLQNKNSTFRLKQYKILLVLNLLCGYGMLISFFAYGYNAVSLIFSLLTILIAVLFTYNYLLDLKNVEKGNWSVVWFKAALFFNLFSSLGTFYLVYMIITKDFNEKWYLSAVYFYLHFQYNGFFLFACMGLLLSKIKDFIPSFIYNKNVFVLFFASAIPAYFLSILWAEIPIWLYIVVVIAAFIQIFGLVLFIKNLRHGLKDGTILTKAVKFMFFFVLASLSIKIFLQLGSTIPWMSKLAFGFRPVVIAYLHLVLLAVISVFLLIYIYTTELLIQSKLTLLSLILFIVGVFLNELALAIQGMVSFGYIPVPYITDILFIISLLLSLSLILLVFSQRKQYYLVKNSDTKIKKAIRQLTNGFQTSKN